MDQKTVLLVEDQLDFLAIHKLYLERHGFRVVTAEDGPSAVLSAQEHRPHVILMDFTIPILDGIGATRQIKLDPATRDIPVVMLTAHAYGTVGRRAREVGCASFISKPCDPRRVLEEVQKLTH
jgi:CheY-like chemotaxis protein